jgi:Arc/MetJ family transcription regulator
MMYNLGTVLWIEGVAIMSTTQIDLDQDLLRQAAAVLGTSTKKATVNEALRRVVRDELRRRHVEELANGALPDLADPDIMAAAWR